MYPNQTIITKLWLYLSGNIFKNLFEFCFDYIDVYTCYSRIRKYCKITLVQICCFQRLWSTFCVFYSYGTRLIQILKYVHGNNFWYNSSPTKIKATQNMKRIWMPAKIISPQSRILFYKFIFCTTSFVNIKNRLFQSIEWYNYLEREIL